LLARSGAPVAESDPDKPGVILDYDAAAWPAGRITLDALIRGSNGHVAFRERRPGALQVQAP
jgi:hypothetical protein